MRLAKRLEEQREALAMAAPLVKPGGRLVYVTCSVLPEENEDQVAAFLASYPDFAPVGLTCDAFRHSRVRTALQMTPRITGCDGFYVACARLDADVDAAAFAVVRALFARRRLVAFRAAHGAGLALLFRQRRRIDAQFLSTMSRGVTAPP